jgi:hypothetical protein
MHITAGNNLGSKVVLGDATLRDPITNLTPSSPDGLQFCVISMGHSGNIIDTPPVQMETYMNRSAD